MSIPHSAVEPMMSHWQNCILWSSVFQHCIVVVVNILEEPAAHVTSPKKEPDSRFLWKTGNQQIGVLNQKTTVFWSYKIVVIYFCSLLSCPCWFLVVGFLWDHIISTFNYLLWHFNEFLHFGQVRSYTDGFLSCCQHLFPSLHDNLQTFYRLQGIQDTALVPVFILLWAIFAIAEISSVPFGFSRTVRYIHWWNSFQTGSVC
jgi:hypothetical protein